MAMKNETNVPLADIAMTVTCAAARRLSDGRRLTAYKATAAYTLKVRPGSSVTATGVKNSIVALKNSNGWLAKINAAMTAKGVNAQATAVTASTPAVTTVSNVSFASSLLSVSVAGV